MEPAFTIEALGEGRGRGVIASRDCPKGSVLCVTAPDIATLYSPFARQLCARCFTDPATRPVASTASAPFVCPTCDQFVLCARCDAAVSADESRTGATCKAAHRLACAWFNELPAAVRAPDQDTDYLRFCLHYGARCALGDVMLRDHLMSLEGNVASQSAETLHFCEVFARDRIVATFATPPVSRTGATTTSSSSSTSSSASPPTLRYTVPWEELRDVLCRTRCNSLGFPFNADATTGWSLEATVCMLNHNCEPNVAIVMAEQDMDCVQTVESTSGDTPKAAAARDALAGKIGIKATRDVRAGEELCISYVDVEDFDGDVMTRTRHLLEQYRFVCRCAKCLRQRDALKTK